VRDAIRVAREVEQRGDLDSAKHWYQGAVEGDDPRAMNALGLLAESERNLLVIVGGWTA
jgi:TPR repeat protein